MNDLVRVLRGQRIDGRGADEIMRRAADEIERLRKEWERECSDGDAVLHAAGLTPADYRTDGGSMNVPKIFGALLTKEVELRTEIERLRRELAEARQLLLDTVHPWSQYAMIAPGWTERRDVFLAVGQK